MNGPQGKAIRSLLKKSKTKRDSQLPEEEMINLLKINSDNYNNEIYTDCDDGSHGVSTLNPFIMLPHHPVKAKENAETNAFKEDKITQCGTISIAKSSINAVVNVQRMVSILRVWIDTIEVAYRAREYLESISCDEEESVGNKSKSKEKSNSNLVGVGDIDNSIRSIGNMKNPFVGNCFKTRLFDIFVKNYSIPRLKLFRFEHIHCQDCTDVSKKPMSEQIAFYRNKLSEYSAFYEDKGLKNVDYNEDGPTVRQQFVIRNLRNFLLLKPYIAVKAVAKRRVDIENAYDNNPRLVIDDVCLICIILSSLKMSLFY